MIPYHDKILITGAHGLVGTSLVAELAQHGYHNLISLKRQECDLTNFDSVKQCFSEHAPDVVFHVAASVYGIGGNTKSPGPIFLDNLLMNTHVIEASRLNNVKKIVAMGTVAAYPEPKTIPVREEHIWEGPPHYAEESYGHAKRAMLAHLMANYKSYGLDYAYVISTNLYGPNDKFDSQLGHVIPSLIRKFYEAKKNNTAVCVWGDGSAARDFLYSKDMARALVLIMNEYTGPINVASGIKTEIKAAVDQLAEYFNMKDQITWDPRKPNGRTYYPVNLENLERLGYHPLYSMQQGLLETLDWFSNHYEKQLIRGY